MAVGLKFVKKIDNNWKKHVKSITELDENKISNIFFNLV